MSSRIALLLLVPSLPLLCYSFSLFLSLLLVLCLSCLVGWSFLVGPFAPSSHRVGARQGRANEFRSIVIAHRGGISTECSGGGGGGGSLALSGPPEPTPIFPENSLAAFRWASSPACGGADAIELDVWLSKDGIPMVNHDQNIFRHFAGKGDISSMTCAELQSIPYLAEPHFPHELTRAVNGFEQEEIKQKRVVIDQKFIDEERMPTLLDVIHLLHTECGHMKCMIEVKERSNISGMCRALKRLYDEHPWMYARCFIASFNPRILIGIRRLDERIVTAFLFIDIWTYHLLKHARDMHVHVPVWLEYNYPLRWIVDDLVWAIGTTPTGLALLGADMAVCEVRSVTEQQIRRNNDAGVLTTVWVVNNRHQKDWLLEQGCSVITDIQFGGDTYICAANKKLRPQEK